MSRELEKKINFKAPPLPPGWKTWPPSSPPGSWTSWYPKSWNFEFFSSLLDSGPLWECLIEMGRSSDQNWKNPIKFTFWFPIWFDLLARRHERRFGNPGDDSQGQKVREGRLYFMCLIWVPFHILRSEINISLPICELNKAKVYAFLKRPRCRLKLMSFSLKQREIPELSDAPDLFALMPNDMVPLQGCHEEAIYLGCYRVKVG